jgi:hypothetical protein
MKIILVYTTILLLAVTSTRSFAQESRRDSAKTPKSYWATFGLGYSSLGALAFHLDANAEAWNKCVITANLQTEVSDLFGKAASNNFQVNTYNLLAGKIFKQKVTFITVSAGLGIVDVITYNGYDKGFFDFVKTSQNSQFTVGVPIIVQWYGVVTEVVGFGINGYVNLNTVRTTAGFTINIALGRMTTRHGKTLAGELPPRRLPF